MSGSGTLADELRDLLRAVSLELPAERGPFEEEADRVSARVGEAWVRCDPTMAESWDKDEMGRHEYAAWYER